MERNALIDEINAGMTKINEGIRGISG